MELQFQENKIPCLMCREASAAVQELTQELRLPDSMPDADRVLGMYAQSVLRSKEMGNGEITVSGGVTAWVLYEPEEGGAPVCADVWIPYKTRMELSGEDGELEIGQNVLSCDARCASPRKLMLRLELQLMLCIKQKSSLSVCLPGDLPEDVQCLKNKWELCLAKEAGEKSFSLEETLSLPGSCPEAGKLLCATAHASVTEGKLLSDKAVFRGALHLQGIVETGSGLCGFHMEQPFSQIVALDGVYTAQANVRSTACITALETALTAEGKIALQCGLVLQYTVYEPECFTAVTDCFSPLRTVEPKIGVMALPEEPGTRETMTAEGQLPCNASSVVDVHLQNGVFQVLYYDTDGRVQSGRIPWQERGNHSGIEPGVCDAMLTAEGLTLRCPVTVMGKAEAVAPISCVTALELGEMKSPDPNRPSVVLVNGQGKSLWELARMYGSSPERIRQANGLQEGEASGMILIPVL